MKPWQRQGIGMTSLRTRERLIRRLQEHGISDFQVLAAIRDVPRHLFVDEALASRAYDDTALPIGFSQTISQPFVVARMLELLGATVRGAKVLEIGTGCGYQTALLAELAERVYSIERVQALLSQTRQRLTQLDLDTRVRMRHGDGHLGWPEVGPFAGIVISAACRRVPDALLAQLAPDGRLVAPVGEQDSQLLTCVQRTERGFDTRTFDAVVFVPMIEGCD